MQYALITIATVLGLVHAFVVVFTVGAIDRMRNANLGDICNRRVKPTFIAFASSATLHYVASGYDWTLILTAIYAAAMTVHLATMPECEQRPLSEWPRSIDEVLSPATSKWLYWLMLPAIACPILLAMTALQ